MPFLLLLFLTLLFPPAAAAYDVKGRVRVLPPFPQSAQIPVNPEHAGTCGNFKDSPALRVSSEGFVQDAVVFIEEDLAENPPETGSPAVLDQKNCVFSPHVLVVAPGSPVVIRNSDDFLHNVRAFDDQALMLFNEAMPIQNQTLRKTFQEPGRFTVRCGIHRWMYAIVIVKKHRFYAVTGADGRFELKDVPPGKFTLGVWHERLGELRQEMAQQPEFLDLALPPAN